MIALSVKGLSKSFGGVQATHDLSFEVEERTVHAVIGPNGAGKTTLINLVTGQYKADRGEVELSGERVTGATPEQLARRGLSRTFQNLQVCMNMSAADNVMIGAHLTLRSGLLAGMLRWPTLRRADAQCRRRALELMEFVGVGAYADSHASQMPYGALKRLEIARALAASPRMLLLDEPAAGLNHTETAGIEKLIREVARQGTTILLVEHDMKLIMGVSDRILVLDHGRKLAEGTVQEVRSNPAVIAAYLGGASA